MPKVFYIFFTFGFDHHPRGDMTISAKYHNRGMRNAPFVLFRV